MKHNHPRQNLPNGCAANSASGASPFTEELHCGWAKPQEVDTCNSLGRFSSSSQWRPCSSRSRSVIWWARLGSKASHSEWERSCSSLSPSDGSHRNRFLQRWLEHSALRSSSTQSASSTASSSFADSPAPKDEKQTCSR